jgi:hypothetical protein
MKLSRPSWCVGVLGILLLGGGPGSTFAATPSEKCAAGKTKALGVGIDARAQCQAAARQSGDAVDPACVAKGESKVRDQFAKAEKDGACPGDADAAVTVVTSCVASFDETVSGHTACAAAKIKAAGKKAYGKSACAKKAALKGTPIEPCLNKVEQKLEKAVAKADAKGACTVTAAALEALVDACFDSLPPPIPCSDGAGHPTCNGTCADGLGCRPYEVFANGGSIETGCSCVDVDDGPECGGAVCGTDQHCDDPNEVCERWMTGDPLGCDHMICQPAMTTPTTLPGTDKMTECEGGSGFPACGGTCPSGTRCQAFQATFDDLTFFAGCLCVDPTGPRCEFASDCNLPMMPFTHCADPSKVCLVALDLTGGEPACSDAHCGDPLPVNLPPTTTTTTSTSTSSSVTTSTSTSTTVPCVSTPGTSGCFQDLGDCTILDTCTGLQWEKKTDDVPGGLHDVSTLYVWSGCCDFDCSTVEKHCQPNAAASATCMALADNGTEGCGLCETGTCQMTLLPGATTTVWDWLSHVNAYGFAGHDDWRLAKENGFNPGPNELESILLMPFPCTTDPLPCIDPIFGPTGTEFPYWSATTKGATGPTRPSDGWFVDFLQGFFGDSGKWGPLHVRAVRDPE